MASIRTNCTKMGDCIYLDYQATTPLDPGVSKAMAPFLNEQFGNPHSEHAFGWDAAQAVDNAAVEVASLIGAAPGEIVFTSGATESNNLAIQGIALSPRRRGNHVVTSAVEHKCVLNTVLKLQESGYVVDVVPVDRTGRVDPSAVGAALRGDTAMVSVMMANNEIGTTQPIGEIGAMCRDRDIVFHTDAAQAVGKLPVDVVDLNVDLLSLSGHKIYGPKGIGALYVSRQSPVPLVPLIHGGAQQQGLRAGTVPPFLCVGLGAACEIAGSRMAVDRSHGEKMRNMFWNLLSDRIPGLSVNGHPEHRIPGNLNLRFSDTDADSLLTSLQGSLAASTGSACNAGMIAPSYVLHAIGLTGDQANRSVRFGFGRFTSLDDVTRAADLIADKVMQPVVAAAVV